MRDTHTVSAEQQDLLDGFLASVNMDALYRQYSWGNDTWDAGFPEIVTLEQRTGTAVRARLLTRSHILAIAEWGGYRDPSRILCANNPLLLPLYAGTGAAPFVETDPVHPVRMIGQQTRGIGPVSASRILRFAMPSVYGAIDSRIVRVFGNGDPDSARFPLLDLIAEQNADDRWSISRQGWPGGYGTWLSILRHIAVQLNVAGTVCPHPASFQQAELRARGVWLPADVEMAIVAYAVRELGR